MQRVYYDSQKEYLSGWSRLFLAVKMVGAVWCGGSALRFFIQACEFRARLIPLPEVFTLLFLLGLMLLFLFLEVLVIYCIMNTPILLLGYRPRKKGQWTLFTTNLLQLPERTSVVVIEEPQQPEKDIRENREQASSPQSQRQQPPTKSPTKLEIAFSFFSRCIIRVKEKVSGVWKDLFLTMRQKVMLAYIAWKARKTPIFTGEVRKYFYEQRKSSNLRKSNNLDRDKSDMKHAVHVAIQSIVEDFGEKEEAVVLLKPLIGKDVYNTISLSEYCSLDIPQQVLFWHEQAQKKHLTQAADPIALSDLRVLYHQVVTEYGSGLFEGDLTDAVSSKNASWWNWAIPDFKEHRNAQISFLNYCIQREETESEQMGDPYHWEECLQQAAWLCKTAIFTCITFDPELHRGERFLQHYLQLCRRLLKRDEAIETYEAYVQRLQRYQAKWEPSSNTEYLLKQVRKS